MTSSQNEKNAVNLYKYIIIVNFEKQCEVNSVFRF